MELENKFPLGATTESGALHSLGPKEALVE